MTPTLLDPCKWMLLGLALCNERFAKRLCHELGPYAFRDGSWERAVYNAIEAGPPYDRILADLGIKMKGKPAESILAAVIKREWNARMVEVGAEWRCTDRRTVLLKVNEIEQLLSEVVQLVPYEREQHNGVVT